MAERRHQTSGGTVWASAIRPANTGVGVFQSQVYSRLAASGFPVDSVPEPRHWVVRPLHALTQVVRPSHVAALVCATPAPLWLRVPVVAVVYDLRWRRTRSGVVRLYRYLDLWWTVRRADQVFTISGCVRAEMMELFPRSGGKCRVLHLGPGLVTDADFVSGEAGVVLLIGGTLYKRNELIAAALVQARPEWAARFLCVGVSDVAVQTLTDEFGPESCERFDGVDDNLMRELFRRASVYVSASTEEGFGLPWVEALAAGCQVVAVRQPLTIEILGDAATLIDDGDVAVIGEQLKHPTWVAEEKRRIRAAMFSWDEVTRQVVAVLDDLRTAESTGITARPCSTPPFHGASGSTPIDVRGRILRARCRLSSWWGRGGRRWTAARAVDAEPGRRSETEPEP